MMIFINESVNDIKLLIHPGYIDQDIISSKCSAKLRKFSEQFKGICIYSNDDNTPISVVVVSLEYQLNAEY